MTQISEDAAFELIRRLPRAGRRHRVAGAPGLRRLLLRTTRYHVYYAPLDEQGLGDDTLVAEAVEDLSEEHHGAAYCTRGPPAAAKSVASLMGVLKRLRENADGPGLVNAVRALIRDVKMDSFELTFRVKSTLNTGNHRDCCIFFNYQDPTHFYYVHLGAKPDPASGQIISMWEG